MIAEFPLQMQPAIVRDFFRLEKRVKCYLIKYVKELPNGFGGTAQGPLIKLLPKYKDDPGLVEHEKKHVHQWYAATAIGFLLCTALIMLTSPSGWVVYGLAPILHPLFYKLFRPDRCWCEVRAYRKQLAIGSYTSSEFAVTALAEKYDLDLSIDKARALLFN